jgi:hypothetical protein
VADVADARLAQAVAWHRQVAALAAAADRAGVAATDLPGIQTRLVTQQSRLAQAAARAGAPLPALVPAASEIATAGAALGDLSDGAVAQTVRSMLSTLDAVDAALGVPAPALAPVGPPQASTPEQPPRPSPAQGPETRTEIPPQWTQGSAVVERSHQRPALRNAAVYGGFAFTVLVVQLGLFVVLDEGTQLPLFAPICLLVLPAFAWLAGFLTIGALFRQKPVIRTPRLGAVICALPDLLLCAGVVLLFVRDRITG